MTGHVEAPVGVRESEDWHALVNQMTGVQRLVHLAWRQVDSDVAEWRNQLFGGVRAAYADTIRAEIVALGCPDPGKVVAREGAELRELARRAQTIADGVVNTYNYDLAREILSIGEGRKTTNRTIYIFQLRNWNSDRKIWKSAQIAETEQAWAVNMAKEAFHSYNADIRAQAEVVPSPTVCPICAEYVKGNPYPSMAELYRRCILPAHPHCPHHGQLITEGPLSRDECRRLWRG